VKRRRGEFPLTPPPPPPEILAYSWRVSRNKITHLPAEYCGSVGLIIEQSNI